MKFVSVSSKQRRALVAVAPDTPAGGSRPFLSKSLRMMLFLGMVVMMATLVCSTFFLGFSVTSEMHHLFDLSGLDLSVRTLDSLPKQEDKKKISVFYNVYTTDVSQLPKVKSITEEQLNFFDSSKHDIYVRTINVPLEVSSKTMNTTLLIHEEEGDEAGTLGLLYDFCSDNPNDKVVYIHSKGSFHPSKENNALRKFLTKGVASEECENLPNTCNVCSSRMAPLPHPHTSGNMWLARCNYVAKLIDPRIFEAEMDRVHPKHPRDPFRGTGRFAAEHWIYSHPDVMPCDLLVDKSFVFGYSGIPDGDFEIDLKLVPRFPVHVYDNGCGFSFDEQKNMLKYRGRVSILLFRLIEYKKLYNMTPSSDWFGWEVYGTGGTDKFQELYPDMHLPY